MLRLTGVRTLPFLSPALAMRRVTVPSRTLAPAIAGLPCTMLRIAPLPRGFATSIPKLAPSSKFNPHINSQEGLKETGAHALVPVRRWLYLCSGMVFGMVALGGATRATGSGLSMTTWNFLGKLPPLSAAEWEAEFTNYKDSPEFKLTNSTMTVDEFKWIFFWEYTHRMYGRAIGMVFAVPYAYFLARGVLPRATAVRCGVILGMIIGQGFLGWYMVKSGLKDGYDPATKQAPRVSAYRLAAHLGSAFTIYLTMLWSALELTFPTPHYFVDRGVLLLRKAAHVTAAMIGITAISGAFVAGLRAGLIYDTFPLMGGRVIPDGFLDLKPVVRNFFENPPTVQFMHRYLAMTSFVCVVSVFAIARKTALPQRTRKAAQWLLAVGCAQVTLGISALLMHVPIPLALAHQSGSLTLLTVALWLLHELRRHRLVRR